MVAGNDLIALGCYDVFAERGISCPDEISVIGYNDIPLMDKLRPPMTTIHIPQFDLGAEAARMLLGCIDEPSRRPGPCCCRSPSWCAGPPRPPRSHQDLERILDDVDEGAHPLRGR